MSLIERDAVLDYMKGWKGETVEFVRKLPAIDAVPIKAISAWLAAYAAPPKYAIDAVNGKILDANDRAMAWEYHWKHLMGCGLMEVDDDANKIW